ncbi:Outer membrane protein assembly factor BamB [Symmachiella macrocystis]|uniref:Outer membrane protein assembly factor BamB n=1 Tax=Symmachiella macrocystis TaxID=2527985 RepID=A0A5C6BTL5_9PLAN|nr:LamG-like jellyroll fold domain-containing protein [Symmachiella macrocystis]TWU14044.1 Outer membrane protein assembly factor BamB [Symmachiella macrocystis]
MQKIAMKLAYTLLFLVGFPSIVTAQAADKPVMHWLLQPEYVDHLTIKDAAAAHAGQINGIVSHWHGNNIAALEFDGLHNRIVAEPVKSLSAPPTLSVSAWVTIDKPADHGGIAGLIQKEKPFATAWLLGYQGDQFTFSGPASTGKTLMSRTRFQPGRWYHVAATDDGITQKLFVNGQQEASAESPTEKNVALPGLQFVIGAARDGDQIVHMHGMIHEIAIYEQAIDAAAFQGQYDSKATAFPAPLEITVGPHVEFLSRTSAVVEWETAQPMPSVVAYGIDKQLGHRVADAQPTTQHRVTLDDIAPDSIYSFQIRGTDNEQETAGKTHVFDSHFNYTLPTVVDDQSPYPHDELTELYESFAERILKETGVTQGYCLVLGVEQGRLAYELAKRSNLKIVAVDDNPANVAAARAALGETPYYGLRISIHEGSLSDLPYGEYFANLVVSDSLLRRGKLAADPGEMYRVLSPSGGTAYLGQSDKRRVKVTQTDLKKWLSEDPNDESRIDENGGLFASVRRGPLTGAGQWTHQYGQADNASCSQDFLVRGKMNVQWWGRPGPRPMPDRGPRNPAPLSAGGRLYIQGDRVLFSLNAYNGTVLWSKQVPAIRRANMPRDCSNMVAADDALYVVEGDHVLKFDGQTGKPAVVMQLPDSDEAVPVDWGYLACVGDTLLGSVQKSGAGYLGDFGEWYDKSEPTSIAKVTSRRLFALDRNTGAAQWNYQGGVIINSTLTVADGRVYFVESRNPAALDSNAGRLVDEVQTGQFLVAVDLQTGEKLWEQPTDLSDASRVIYLVHTDDTLAVTGSSNGKYHIWAFNNKEGKPLWKESFAMKKDDHGGAIQHPVAVGSTLYCELRGYNLRTGKLERTDLPQRRGCGTMAASNYAFFYRHRFHGMWDLETNTQSEFQGIRGGCWLGQIPAAGLMLAPESSAGCSCTHSIQISVGYIPSAMTKQTPPSQ